MSFGSEAEKGGRTFQSSEQQRDYLRVHCRLQLWEERSGVWLSRVEEGKVGAPEKFALLITLLPQTNSKFSLSAWKITSIQNPINTKPDKDMIRKLQPNIPHENRPKNPQQNISKSDSATHKKDNTLWLSRVYLRNARVVKHLKINQCNLSYQKDEK